MHLRRSHFHAVRYDIAHLLKQHPLLELRFELRGGHAGLLRNLILVSLHSDEFALIIEPGNSLERLQHFLLGHLQPELVRLRFDGPA